MAANENIATIKSIYEAFGREDAEAIVGAVSDDVDWATDTASEIAPWWGVRHGKDRVLAFFADFATTMEVEEFTPLTFAANDDDVLTVVRFQARSRETGKVAAMQLHHWFRFRDGKVAYYRGTEDTVSTVEALTA